MNAARDLVKFGEEVDFIGGEAEAAERWQAKIKGEEKLKGMQRQELEDAKRRSGFNWLRDGEHCNKLFFATSIEEKKRIGCRVLRWMV